MLTAVIWLGLAFACGLIFRVIGMPPLVGYLAAGFILSTQGYSSNHILEEVSHAGVLMLLFAVGLKLHLKSLIRPEILFGSLVHMVIMVSIFSVLLMQLAGLAMEVAIVLAIALSFSSTVVAAKVLESKRELRAFHGRVTIGILIVQDLVAVALLSYLGGTAPSLWAFALLGLLLLRPVLFRLLELSGHGELVILFGVVMALLFGGKAFTYVGLSSELGALVLGMLFAGHARSAQLANAIWGLKEMLLVGFFLQIGLVGMPTLEILGQAALLNIAIVVKAMLFFGLLMMLRLRARSAFLAGLSLASFSEFGLIVVSMGVDQGLLDAQWLVLLAVTVALSFAISSPFNRHSHEIYQRYRDLLCRFESKRHHPDDEPMDLGSAKVVVIGMGRVGRGAYDEFAAIGHDVIGLDSDQVQFERHEREGRHVLYADAEDPGFWDDVDLSNIEIVVLSLPELHAKLLAISQLKSRGFEGVISAAARFSEDMDELKDAGAHIVYDYYGGVGVGLARLTLESNETA